MGRPKNPIWNQVTIIGESEKERKWLCNRCGKRYGGGATRINEHLGITKGKGNITLCPRRHDLLANEGVNNSMLPGSSNQVEAPNELGLNNGVLPASSNQLEDPNGLDSLTGIELADPMNPYHEEAEGHPNTISACFDGPIDQNDVAGPSNMVEGLPHSDEVLEGGSSGFETDIEDEVLEKLRDLVDELTGSEEEVKEELQWLEYCGKKKREREEADDWLKKAGDFKKEARDIIDSFPQDALQDLQMKTHDLRCRLYLLEDAKPVCCNDEEDLMDAYFTEMRKLLRDDNVFFIGVCGMGGVGKTWLATHFRNQIRRNKSFNFENVFWVTVSQDFSILKLQNSIANRIGEKLDDDDEITDRAEILSSALEKIDRSIFILDDVWNYIDLQKVGIPLKINGIKLILTSRLKHVFRQMDCPTSNVIEMKPLPVKEQDWELFLLNLGCDGRPASLSDEVENTAKSVVKMCEGLPLGITVMARLMKGVNDDINIWRHALSKLEDSSMEEDMEEEVIKVLKRSYDHLADKTIQNCFLQHALYSEVSDDVFIMNLVDEGLIQSTSSLEKIFVQGKAIVAKLKSHSLIDCLWDPDSSDLHMHGLLREMASHIMKGRFMLRCGKSLHNIPEMQEWAPLLEKVSLMDNRIEEIPEGTSPECPQLSTLNFSKNMITYIPDCFFYRIKALTLLDLSYNKKLTSLPNSLSSLRCLKSLLLQSCHSLESVPPLGNLQELSRLVISGTSIKELPDGLKVLTKLRWLDLSNNRKLVCVEWSVIFGLTNVQYLNLQITSLRGEVEIVHGMMSRLEYFVGYFQVAKHLADFVENILNRDGGLKYYHIGFRYSGMFSKPDITGRKRKFITVEDFEGFEFLLPSDLDQLDIINNKQWSGDLCGALSFKAPSSLREIKVRDCPKLERLCCMSGRCSFCQHLQNLQSLELFNLERLDAIWSEEDEFIGLPNLSQLKISNCDRIERLMGAAALAKFPKLECIKVESCKSMKEVFATGMSEDDPDLPITFPNSFKLLDLWELPELVSVCGSIRVSEFPAKVWVHFCPKL
ncbi:probable disease resistance protein At4g27220 isoform X2 [Arachis duranensis]|uniref:Probable disease resistance protein At4g27220 isoform X2 n=1 Tax=Arachis duranensis TaxID=130453 RepID=A0A9C6TNB7_ARADU|nr:probable disease resistance protein At4g27220 isoform X2 [Arachis duranensis]